MTQSRREKTNKAHPTKGRGATEPWKNKHRIHTSNERMEKEQGPRRQKRGTQSSSKHRQRKRKRQMPRATHEINHAKDPEALAEPSQPKSSGKKLGAKSKSSSAGSCPEESSSLPSGSSKRQRRGAHDNSRSGLRRDNEKAQRPMRSKFNATLPPKKQSGMELTLSRTRGPKSLPELPGQN